MKIIISVAGFFPQTFGGGQIYVYRVGKELLSRGHSVTVLTPVQWTGGKDSYVIDKYMYENIPVFCFSSNPELVSAAERHTGFGPLTIDILRKILRECSPDIVHINGSKPAWATICNESKIPHVVTVHHAGIACPAGGLLRPDYSICNKSANYRDCVPCCCLQKRPKWYVGGVLGQIPSWIYRPLGAGLNHIKNLPYIGRGLIYPWLVEQALAAEKVLFEKAELIIAPSLAMQELMIRNGCGPEKVLVLPHGIEPLNRVPLGRIDARPVRFGYIGRIDPSKGLRTLLGATELLSHGSQCEVHIFGAARNSWDEDYRKKVLANYRGKAKIFDHGLFPQEKLEEAYVEIDVLVVPSLLPEAFGLVVSEAFSAGRPVIVFNSGALPEQVRHGVDGFVVERNDSKALAEAMQRFMDTPDLIIKMSKQILPVKTMREYIDEIEGVYRQCLEIKF